MPDVAIRLELECSLEQARSILSETGAFLCFPGIGRAAGGRQTARLEQEIELPLIGPRTQSVEVSIEETHPSKQTTYVIFAACGALVSVSGCWTLEEVDGRVDARLTAGYLVTEAVIGQAIDELRSHSPLPIRTDADAILRRAVGDFFDAYFVTALAAYRDQVRGIAAGRP